MYKYLLLFILVVVSAYLNAQESLIHYNKGVAGMHYGEYDKAIEEFTFVVDNNAEYLVESYLKRGNCFYRSYMIVQEKKDESYEYLSH